MKSVFKGPSLIFEGFYLHIRSCFLIKLLNVVREHGVEMCDCFRGAVVEAVEVLFERCWPELQSFRQWAWYYSLIAQSMNAGGLTYAYIPTAAFALCEGKSASK